MPNNNNTSRRWRFFSEAAVLFACLAFSPRAGADTPPDAGRVLQEQQPPTLTLPESKPRALELQPPAAKPARAGERVVLRNFRIKGNLIGADNGSELLALLDDARGKSFDLAGMEELAARITRYYRARGFPFARAYLPPQEIRNGVLEIAVIEGRFFKVDVHNDSNIPGLMVELWPGEPIESDALERGLLLLSDIPGITVRSTLKPGAEVGTSDLLIDIAPGRRVIGSVDLDNYGNHYTGEYRGGTTVIINNPTQAADQLYLRASSAGSGMVFGTLNYSRLIGNDGFKLGAVYARVQYELGSDFEYLDAHGTADIFSVYAAYPFVRSRAFNLNGQFGLTQKQQTDIIGLADTNNEKSVDSGVFTLSGNNKDSLLGGGANSFSAKLTAGNISIDSAAAKAQDKASAKTSGGFASLNLSALRSQRLAEKFSLYAALSGQFASKNLISSEKFSLGGPYGVRAYPQGEATGDEGLLANLELRYALARTWQLTAFLDGGQVTINRDPWTDGDNSRDLYGYGIGCNWNSSFGFALRASLAWKLGSEMPNTDADRSPRAWLQLTQYF